MNMHGIVSNAIGAINPFINAVLRENTGFTIALDGSRGPTFNDYVAQIQVQAQTEDQLALSANQGYQGILRSVYLNGNWTGIVKSDQTGNDELYFNGYRWMIYHVIEIWPDWCHVLVAQQTKSTVATLTAFPGLDAAHPQASASTTIFVYD